MNNQFDNFFSDSIMESADMFPIISLDENASDIELADGEVLAILPLRNMVIFPGVLMPISVARSKSLKLIRNAYENNKLIGVCSQIDKKSEDPSIDQLYQIGTAAQIVRILEMPDNSTTVIIEGKKRFRLGDLVSSKPYIKAKIYPLNDIMPQDPKDGVVQALISSIKDITTTIIQNSGFLPPESIFFQNWCSYCRVFYS